MTRLRRFTSLVVLTTAICVAAAACRKQVPPQTPTPPAPPPPVAAAPAPPPPPPPPPPAPPRPVPAPAALSEEEIFSRKSLDQVNAEKPLDDVFFDLVTSFDVLYGLDPHDERAAVAEMYRLARPGGYAIFNVAAMDVLRGDHSVLSREVRRYSHPTLAALITHAGFTIVRLTYTNTTLFLPLAVIRTAHRMRGLASEADAQQEISVPPAPINAVLSGVLFLESVWLRHFDSPLGSSLLCLARKPA